MLNNLNLFGVDVSLEPAAGVFMPSPNGLFYARSIKIARGERVIDIGTGSGVLAIAAAKCGAEVEATDIDPRAVAASQHNATLNGVTIDCRICPLFADFKGAFDVILANLPNKIVAPAHLASLPPGEASTFAGGTNGNAAILALLTAGPPTMRATWRVNGSKCCSNSASNGRCVAMSGRPQWKGKLQTSSMMHVACQALRFAPHEAMAGMVALGNRAERARAGTHG
jgi:SAM-dependent methyltransferase